MDSLKCQTATVSPAEPGDFPFLVKVEQIGGQLTWYHSRKLNETSSPWRANVKGPGLPETNPIFQYKTQYPGRYAVGVLVLPAGSPVSLANRQETVFEVAP